MEGVTYSKVSAVVNQSVVTENSQWWFGDGGEWEATRKLLGVMDVFIILIVVMTYVYTYVRTYQSGTLNMCSLLHSNYTSVKLFYFKCYLLPHSSQSPGL